MNTQYFIYAIEVEKTGSITQAANNLFMSQPTLSKAIRDMESSVGFPVFKRTSKGVVPTQRGTEFLIYAKKIAAQLQKMDAILHAQDTSHQLFSLAIPRVSYIAKAASEYVCSFDNQRDMEVDILETSSMRVIDSVAYGHYVLGIIRYHTEDEDYFLKSLAEAGLQYELLWQSGYVALMRHDHPLAQREQLTARDFDPYVEIAFGDEEVPYIRVSESKACSCFLRSSKRILVYDRATQFDLLRAADVQNQGVVLWTTLGFKNFRHGSFVQTVCAQTVNRLRGDRHQLPPANQVSRNLGRFRVQCGQKKCLHQYTSS